jgi:nucleoside-diphosphate-sugar epimerase
MGKTKRQVVVFGATGEIGGRIAKGCVEAGHKVVGISRGTNKRSIPDVAGVEMLYGDRSDEEFLRNTLEPLGFDTIIDSVPNANSIARYAEIFPDVKNVFICSSTGTYVPLQYFPADENHPWREQTAVNFFNQSQIDMRALELWETQRFPITIFRPTNIIGRGRIPLDLWGGRDIEFFRALKAGEKVSIPRCENVLIQSGSNSDLAGAFVKALDAPDAVRGEIFIISCRRAITLGRYLQTAMEALQSASSVQVVGNDEILHAVPGAQWKGRLEFLLEHMCFDIGKAERIFGYQPKKSTEEGLRDALTWCQSAGLL